MSRPAGYLPASPSLPNADALDEAASILAKAKNPVIITNWGGRNPNVMPALVDLADKYAIPVVEYRNRFVAMPRHHPMFAGGNPNPFVEAADAILVMDCATPWLPSQVSPSEDCKVIHIGTRSALQLSCRSAGSGPTLRWPVIVPSGLVALNAGMDEASKSNQAVNRQPPQDQSLHCMKNLEESWAKKLQAVKDQTPIHPAWISDCIAKISDADTIFAKESQLQVQYLDTSKPTKILNAGASSGLGHGMGVALGAKLANRDNLVIGTHGDGSYMFNVPVSAHYVAAEQECPILSVVFNNQKWQAVRGSTMGMYPDGYAAKGQPSAADAFHGRSAL